MHNLVILVADDEIEIANFVSDVLRDEGYTVECVYDGASALLALQGHSLDLVILDNAMPVMTGAEVLRTARAQGFGKPIIMMSANTRGELLLREGANAFLAKPFTIDTLIHTVAGHLG
jgi:two-component system response regulator TctD